MPLFPINTPEYIRDLMTRVDEFDRIALRLLAEQIEEMESDRSGMRRPDGIYSQFHLDNWTDDDFAKHAAATRKTLVWLLELETVQKKQQSEVV